MRTAIFFVGLELYDISLALSGKHAPDAALGFVGWLLIFAMVMDLVDFFNGLSKK